MKKILLLLTTILTIGTLSYSQCNLTISGPTTVCSGAITYYSVLNPIANLPSWTITGPSPIPPFTSSFPPYSDQSMLNVSWPTVSSDVTYTIMLGTCAYPVLVKAAPNPSLQIVPGVSAICIGSTGSATMTTSSGVTYSWFLGGIGNSLPTTNPTLSYNATSPTAQIITTTSTTPGTYNLFAGYNNGSCSGTQTISRVPVTNGLTPVSISPIPAASYCQNMSQTFTANGDALDSYTWTLPNGTHPTGQSINYTFSTIGNNEQISVSGTNTCSNNTRQASTNSFNVIASVATPAAPTGPATVCPGDSPTFSTNNVTNATSYTWKFVNSITSTTTILTTSGVGSNSITTQLSTSGDYSLTVSASNGTCASPYSSSTSFTVWTTQQYQGPPVNLTPQPQIACMNAATTLTVPAGPTGCKYTWGLAGGISNPSDPSNSNTISVSWSSAGSKSVSIAVVTPCNPSKALNVYSMGVNVIDPASPFSIQPISGTTSNICLNGNGYPYWTQSSDFSNPITSINWTTTPSSAATVSPPTSTYPTITNPMVVWRQGGSPVTLKAIATNGCGLQSQQSISVTPSALSFPIAFGLSTSGLRTTYPSAGGPQNTYPYICPGALVTFTLAGSEQGVNYTLNDGLGNTVAGTGSSINWIESPPAAVSYNVTAQNTLGCSTTIPGGNLYVNTISLSPYFRLSYIDPQTSSFEACPLATVPHAYAGEGNTQNPNIPIMYQWFKNSTATNSNGTNVTVPTSGYIGGDIYLPQNSISGSLYYYVTATQSDCPIVTSSAIGPAKIETPSNIVTQPSTATQNVCTGGASPLAVSATGDNLVYEWYYNSTNSNIGGTLISNSNSASYTPTIVGSYYYFAKIYSTSLPNHSTCSSVTSNTSGAITISALPTTAYAGANQAICSTSYANLYGNNPTIGTGSWSVSSGPSTASSQFSNSASQNSTFTPTGGAGSYVLTWSITNGYCAPSTSDVTITVSAPPTTAIAGPDQTICSVSSATLAGNNPTVGTGAWTVSSGPTTASSQFSSTSNPTATFTPTGGAGSYVLKWTISNSSCTASTSNATITVNAPPTIADAGVPQTICSTSSASLLANYPMVGTAVWSVSSGPSTSSSQFSSTTSRGATFTPAGGAGSYVLTWTISNSPCTASTSNVTITVNAPPTTSNAGPAQTICTANYATLAANTPTVGNGNWTVSGGPSTASSQLNSTTNPAATFTPAGGAGTYYLTWAISNSPCTPSTSYVTITVNTSPTTSNAGPDQTICSINSATLAANNPTIGTGAWTVSSGPSTASSQFSSTSNRAATFTPAGGAGTYVLTWTISTGLCTSSSNVTITVNAPPSTANAGPAQTICSSSSATLAANNPTVGTGAWTVFSGPSTASSQFSSTSNPTATFTPAGGAGSYVLTWTISNSPCTASTSNVTITVNAPPTTANAGPDQTGTPTCGLTQVTLAGNAPTTGTGAWSIVNGTGGTITTPSSPTSTFTGTAGSTYTLRWTISNSPCTNSTDDVVVTFNQNPTTANAGPDQTGVSTCGLTPITLAGNAPAVGSGLWSIVNGTGGTINTPSSPTSTFTGTAGSTYTLRWTISNSPCTNSTDDVVVTFNQNPTTANAGPDQTGASTCGLTPITLAGNAPAVGSGLWSIVNGTGGTITTPSSPTSTFTGTAGSTYTLRWTISNSPCTNSTDDVVVTFNRNPTTANAGSNQTICVTGSTTLAANAPTVGTGSWTVTSGPSVASSQFSSTTNRTATFTPAGGAGSYVLTWTISNSPCTASTSNVTITVNPTSVSGTISGAGSVCSGINSKTLTLSGYTGTIQWQSSSPTNSSFSNITNATSTTYTATNLIATTYYRVVVTSSPCAPVNSSYVAVTISGNPPPATGFAISTPNGVNICSSVVLTAPSGTGYAYSWSTGETTQSINPSSIGDFFVTITSCGTSSTSATVRTTRSPSNCPIPRLASNPQSVPQNLDLPDVEELTVYPNPSNSELTIAMPYKMKEDTHVNFYNLQGVLVMNPYLKKGEWQLKINSSQMTEGLYVIKVGDSDWVTSAKVMIVH